MAKAFKCAMTGELVEGDGTTFVDVPVKDGSVILRVSVYVVKDKQTVVSDVMSDGAAREIVKCLSGVTL
jgi:hypothetical protein